MKPRFSPLMRKIALMAILATVAATLVIARQQYLSNALSDEAIVTAKSFREKTAGHMLVKVPEQDSFLSKNSPTPGVLSWELSSGEKGLSAEYFEINITGVPDFNLEQEMFAMSKNLWPADKPLKEENHRFYLLNGKTVFEGNYILDIFERRVLMCAEKNRHLAMILLTTGQHYANAVQDSMVSSVRFR